MAFSDYLDVIGTSREFSAARVGVAEAPSGPTLWLTGPEGDLPQGVGWEALVAAGFSGAIGQVHVVAGGVPTALVGLGAAPDEFRDAAALASRALGTHTEVSLVLPEGSSEVHVRAAVEGALLARYRYDALRAEPQGHRITSLTVVAPGCPGAPRAAREGSVFAEATALTRDLANTPHNHLTATRFANLVAELGAQAGLEVEVWDQQRCVDERLGALLAINAGSKEEARFVRVRYTASGSKRTLGLVGKGIMYDSGGIGLKPNDDSHAQMKNDMTGAAAIVAAMLALPALGAPHNVTGYLMCTDNMPSASATALGDVVRGRGGETMEIVDTDAEGRVVMSDGLTLAAEDGVDAVIDIATLTGSVARAFGPLLSGVSGSDEGLIDLVTRSAAAVGEPVAFMPLERRYAAQLKSPVADIRNVGPLGQPDGILSALFLHYFSHGLPWAHLDIAGTAFTHVDEGWRSRGCTGTGARTLLAVALDF